VSWATFETAAPWFVELLGAGVLVVDVLVVDELVVEELVVEELVVVEARLWACLAACPWLSRATLETAFPWLVPVCDAFAALDTASP
jgi:hypothetical protein